MSAHPSPDDPPPSRSRDDRRALTRMRFYDLERLSYTEAANIPPRPPFTKRWRVRLKIIVHWICSQFRIKPPKKGKT